jgi:hypothetical protein
VHLEPDYRVVARVDEPKIEDALVVLLGFGDRAVSVFVE